MRLEVAIDALRPFADSREHSAVFMEAAKRLAERVVREYDSLPQASGEYDPTAAASATVTVGIRGERVILQSSGNEEVEPSYIVWTPAQAREIAGHLMRLARLAELESRGQ